MRYALVLFGSYTLRYLGVEPLLPLIVIAMTLCMAQDIKEIIR